MTTAQLRREGVDKFAVNYRVKVGRLHRLYRGVYAVGHPHLGFEGRCLAAVLACGDRAALSHRSAASLWGMLPRSSVAVDVTVPTLDGRVQRPGLTIHRSATLVPSVVTDRVGIPITRPARTIRDLQRAAAPQIAQRAMRSALDLKLIEPESLGSEADLTRSELERLFLRLCRRHRLPRPDVNARVGTYEVDFLWRDQRLVVETDGFRFHSDRLTFEADRARDAELQALGYRVLRFTYRQVRESSRSVVSTLRRVIEQAA